MRRVPVLGYAILAYLAFILTIIYSIAFIGNFFVARTIDSAAVVPFGEALAVNLGLLLLFALQHSGMARKSFKNWLQTHLSHGLDRSTYVLASSITILLVMALWQPMGGVVWSVSGLVTSKVIVAIFFAGWGLMIYATFLINHLELFGLRPERKAEFQTPGVYRHVRHPIYLGWLLVMWASPIMTVAHLVFAAGMTIYMLIGIEFEERDLAAELPDYPQYQRKVPMLFPSWRKRLLRKPDN